MDNALFRRLLLYRTTMAAVKIMLDSGLISDEEYAVTDTIIAEKYGLNGPADKILDREKGRDYVHKGAKGKGTCNV